MRYKLRNDYQPLNVDTCLKEILALRGVKDIESFLNPTKDCELKPYDLENIELGAQMLTNHLQKNSKICFVVD